MGLFTNILKAFNIVGNAQDSAKMLTDHLKKTKKGKFKQKKTSYYDSVISNLTPEKAKLLLDKCNRFGSKEEGSMRRCEPLSYEETVVAGHRDYLDMDFMRIGDLVFKIPPQFINITNVTPNETMVTLRQSDQLNNARSFSRKTITVTLFFNGENQINGYEVPAPSGVYHMDGFRSLLAQFKMTPFVPIVNQVVNNTANVHNVALSNMIFSTCEGYPDTFEVTLTMTEVNVTPFTDAPDFLFTDMIDWDLFRFNYQRLLTGDGSSKNHIPKYEASRRGLIIKQIRQDALAGYKRESSIYYDSNFETILDSRVHSFVVQNVNAQMANIISVNQLAGQVTPSAQYIGGMGYSFNLIIETGSEEVLQLITGMQNAVQSYMKMYKEYGTFGFIKIESQAINVTGTEYVIFDRVLVSTVEGFPGMYRLEIACSSFDIGQNERESINGMLPFEGDTIGTSKDAITQSATGVINSIKQDSAINKKLEKLELYPDLFLPTYTEVDDFIAMANIFKSENGLKTLGYTAYTRPKVLKNGVYENKDGLYVDPDFYVFYPMPYADVNDEIFKTFKGPAPITNVSTVGRSVEWGDAPQDGFIYDSNNDLVGVDGISGMGSANPSSTSGGNTGNDLADYLVGVYKKGCGYIMGANGQTFTQSMWENNTIWNYTGENKTHAKKWIGKQVFDCSSFVSYGLRELGYVDKNYRGVVSSFQNLAILETISRNEVRAGDICLKVTTGGANDHMAVAIDNQQTVEAKGVKYGVVLDKIGNRYTAFKRIKSSAKPKKKEGSSPSASSNFYGIEYAKPNIENLVQKPVTRTGVGASSSDNGNKPAPAPPPPKRTAASYITAAQLNSHFKNSFAGKGEFFMKMGDKYGINPAFMAAVMQHETGWGTSAAIKKCNNPGGIMDWDNNHKTLRKFSSLDAGIEFTFSNMKKLYIDEGLATVESIAKKYAPVPADNDPTGLNKNWPKTVRSIYKTFTGKDEVVVKIGDVGLGAPDAESTGPTKSEHKYSKSENHGVEFGKGSVELTYESFGVPVFEPSPIGNLLEESESRFFSIIGNVFDFINPFDSKEYENMNKAFMLDASRTLPTMFVDMCSHSCRGRILRMFPSYVFLIADEGGDWLDGRKLWSNYYVYKSVTDIAIHSTREFPTATAEINVTNIHHSLDDKMTAQKGIELMTESLGGISKWLYKNTGAMIGSPKLVGEMIEIKNTLYDSINLKAGAKIHLRLGFGSDASAYPINFNGHITDVNLGDGMVTLSALSLGHELINNVISADQKNVNSMMKLGSEPSDIIATVLTKRSSTFLSTVSKKWGENSAFGIENFGIGRGFEVTEQHKEYDILKNIYYGKYSPSLFCLNDGFANFDGEANVNFYLYNKTPWDAFQYLSQTLPEFVAQPINHNYSARLFFGLPFWACKYEYVMVENIPYESAKTFAQFHYIDSLSDIIDNQISVDGESVTTNCIGTYTLGSGTTSSPTVYSDRTILGNHQRTEIIDTTLEQDYFGPDWIMEKISVDVGKQGAIKMCISNLLDGWERVYSGEVIIIGDSSIKPCDYLFINDNYSSIKGLCKVREVVHRLSIDGGFTTSITPDMISTSTMKNSGQGNIIKTLISVGSSMGAVKVAREAVIQTTASFGAVVSTCRFLAESRSNPISRHIIESIPSFYLGKFVMAAVRTGEIFLKFSEYSTKALSVTNSMISTIKVMKIGAMVDKGVDFAKGVKGAATVAKIASGAKGGLTAVGTYVAPGIGTAVAWAVGTVIFDWILGALIDEFAYNHSVTVFPLSYKNEAFINGIDGATTLIPGHNQPEEKPTLPDDETAKDKEINDSVS